MKDGIRAVAFFLAYIAASRLSHELADFAPLGITAIWIPAGVGVAAFLSFDWWAVPLVWFASLASAYPEFGALSPMHVLPGALGDTLQAAVIWRLWCSDLPDGLVSVGDVLRLAILACFVPVVVGSLEAAGNLFLGNDMVWRRLLLNTLAGGIADALGVLLVVPAYWSWRALAPLARNEKIWITVHCSLMAVVLYASLRQHASIFFVSIALLFAAAMQTGLRGETLAQALLVLGLTAVTARGAGPFAAGEPFRAYGDLLTFICSVGFASMGLAVSHTRLLTEKNALESVLHEQSEILKKEVTEREWLQQQVMHRAHSDELTGLPNRAMFFDRLEQSIIQSRRRGTRFALFFIDLDGFKDVNDTWGHETGDFLLRQVGERLRACVRESDTIARMGGDEFTIIINDISFRRSAAIVADKVIATLAKPFLLSESMSHVGASIGIAIYPDDGEEAEVLMHHADAAMYSVKREGKNDRKFFDPETDTPGLQGERQAGGTIAPI